MLKRSQLSIFRSRHRKSTWQRCPRLIIIPPCTCTSSSLIQVDRNFELIQSFFVPNFAPDFVFFPLAGISARGPQGSSHTALRPDSLFWPHMQLGFPPSALFRKGRPRKNQSCCAPLVPSLILYRCMYTMYRLMYKHFALLTSHSRSRCISHCQQPG